MLSLTVEICSESKTVVFSQKYKGNKKVKFRLKSLLEKIMPQAIGTKIRGDSVLQVRHNRGRCFV